MYIYIFIFLSYRIKHLCFVLFCIHNKADEIILRTLKITPQTTQNCSPQSAWSTWEEIHL